MFSSLQVAVYYHAGLSGPQRAESQSRWMEGEVPIMVATIAFGMGINKANVRAVIHEHLPKSVTHYYQESGRAGRDGLLAYCILFWTWGDRERHDFLLARSYREGTLSASEMKKQKEEMNEVIRFCENEYECRRTQILAYFNESFPRYRCRKMCDVCADPRPYVPIDFTYEACLAVAALRSVRDAMAGAGMRNRVGAAGTGLLTLKQLASAFDVSGSTKGKKGANATRAKAKVTVPPFLLPYIENTEWYDFGSLASESDAAGTPSFRYSLDKQQNGRLSVFPKQLELVRRICDMASNHYRRSVEQWKTARKQYALPPDASTPIFYDASGEEVRERAELALRKSLQKQQQQATPVFLDDANDSDIERLRREQKEEETWRNSRIIFHGPHERRTWTIFGFFDPDLAIFQRGITNLESLYEWHAQKTGMQQSTLSVLHSIDPPTVPWPFPFPYSVNGPGMCGSRATMKYLLRPPSRADAERLIQAMIMQGFLIEEETSNTVKNGVVTCSYLKLTISGERLAHEYTQGVFPSDPKFRVVLPIPFGTKKNIASMGSAASLSSHATTSTTSSRHIPVRSAQPLEELDEGSESDSTFSIESEDRNSTALKRGRKAAATGSRAGKKRARHAVSMDDPATSAIPSAFDVMLNKTADDAAIDFTQSNTESGVVYRIPPNLAKNMQAMVVQSLRRRIQEWNQQVQQERSAGTGGNKTLLPQFKDLFPQHLILRIAAYAPTSSSEFLAIEGVTQQMHCIAEAVGSDICRYLSERGIVPIQVENLTNQRLSKYKRTGAAKERQKPVRPSIQQSSSSSSSAATSNSTVNNAPLGTSKLTPSLSAPIPLANTTTNLPAKRQQMMQVVGSPQPSVRSTIVRHVSLVDSPPPSNKVSTMIQKNTPLTPNTDSTTTIAPIGRLTTPTTTNVRPSTPHTVVKTAAGPNAPRNLIVIPNAQARTPTASNPSTGSISLHKPVTSGMEMRGGANGRENHQDESNKAHVFHSNPSGFVSAASVLRQQQGITVTGTTTPANQRNTMHTNPAPAIGDISSIDHFDLVNDIYLDDF